MNRTITQEQAKAFLDELSEVCRKHNLMLSHEDTQGSFLVVPLEPGDKIEAWIAKPNGGQFVE